MVDQSRILPGMQVLTSDGELIGMVDRPSSDGFMMNRMAASDAGPETVPSLWVHQVDQHVHLNRTGAEVISGWSSLKFTTSSGDTPATPASHTTTEPAGGGRTRTVLLVVGAIILAVVLLIALGIID